MVGLLVIVVLLLVIMPALLYLMSWGVVRYTRKAPSWLGSPPQPQGRNRKPNDEATATGKP